MRKIIKYTALCVLFQGLLVSKTAAQIDPNIAKGMSHEMIRNYSEASRNYQKSIKLGNDFAYLYMANLSYKLADYTKSFKYYKEAMKQGLSMNSNEWLRFYQSAKVKDDKPTIDTLSYLINKMGILGQPFAYTKIKTKNVKAILRSDRGSQYAPFFKGNYIYYAAINGFMDPTDIRNQMSDVYVTGKKDERISLRNAGLPDFNTEFNDGPIFLTKDEDYLFITTNHINGQFKKLKFIYYQKINGLWQGPYTPNFIDDRYNYAYPVVDADGRVVFSSDKANGLGGMDLYAVSLKKLPAGKPENLGKEINTPFNEVFPGVYGKSLLFSSDGYNGFGGLDILEFYNGKVYLFDSTVNTIYDDFSANIAEGKIVFSSNVKTKGKSDKIYQGDVILGRVEEIIAPETVVVEKPEPIKQEEPEKPIVKEEPEKPVIKEVVAESASKALNISFSAKKPYLNPKPNEPVLPISLNCESGYDSVFFIVCGVFGDYNNATKRMNLLKNAGSEGYIMKYKNLNRVMGSRPTANKESLQSIGAKIKAANIDYFITGVRIPSSCNANINLSAEQKKSPNQYITLELDYPGLATNKVSVSVKELLSGKIELPVESLFIGIEK
jgi:tetratricopeptide (TPR) repeat protein